MHLFQLINSQALRSTLNLEPIDGPNGRVFPPTYSADNEGADRKGDNARSPHVVEKLPDGSLRVLIDSVASQANRQEAALVEARNRGLIDFADVYVDLSETEAGLKELSATEMPHRLSDAILRDSELDGKPFGKSEFGKAILSATLDDLTPILEAAPTTVLFGCWFSQHNLPRALKLQRSIVSEIWAENAVLGKAVGSRIDPLQVTKLKLYEAADGEWTALEEDAVVVAGKPKIFKKKAPSEINHGNIAPSVRDQGITAERITLKWAMPIAAIRRLRFGGGKRDQAGQAYVAALGVLARVLDHDHGYSLRSRCDLISTGPATFDLIDRDGAIESVTITTETALALLHQAEDAARSAGIKLHGNVTVKPGKRLVGLIHQSAHVQAAGGRLEDAEVSA
jgi:CRISPR-associated protein Csb1